MTLKSINMTEGSFGVEEESLYAVKLSSRATPTDSMSFLGLGRARVGEGSLMGTGRQWSADEL